MRKSKKQAINDIIIALEKTDELKTRNDKVKWYGSIINDLQVICKDIDKVVAGVA